MLSEVLINSCSQLAYLDLPEAVAAEGWPTVGALADYYIQDPVGKAYLKTRFSSIPQEYEDWKNFLSGGVDPVREFRICNVLDDNKKTGSGFYGCSYLSPDGDLVAAFRGSEMLGNAGYKNDYETDFALAYETQTPQQKLVDRYLTAFDDFRAKPYVITGHSLGGNLALYGAVHAPLPGRMTACYAFNAPGFNEEFVTENKERIGRVKDRLYLMQNQFDLVSSLLLDIADPVILESTFDPKDQEEPGVPDILYPHSNFVYKTDGTSFVRDGEKDMLCAAVNKATVLFLKLPNAVKRTIAKLLLDLIYSNQSDEKKTAYMLERITKYMVRTGIEADSASLQLGESLFTARQIYGGESEGKLYKTLCESGGTDSASLGRAMVLLYKLVRYCADAAKSTKAMTV